ncbi:uncharacterized protein F5Z01DRAFT_631794 [Emericellopsis atlantica]|uniref:Uncharacterized protein n=1 Tax=Emericellopsis atlantica TaxID=2614577 RepID=A0A9P8CJV8_9HYPO|nr:uncharacterized protein F5Z01DRAFT_631794 [Emericellopsis atlantica]KAG9249402.1 hypothetical protein F5Z01DRAFT_631794 [Emericellopsis atlantica]
MVVFHDSFSPSAIPTSRKRRYSPHSSPPPADDAAHTSSKKRKICHPTSPPPEFWDNLTRKSQIPLTTNALQELNRRNTQRERRNVAPLPPLRRSCRLAARPARFASHGGPDSRDLRGYRMPTGLGNEMRSSTPSSLGRRKRGSQSPEKSSGTPNTTTTKSTGPYDRAYLQHHVDNGFLPDGYEYPDGRALSEAENIEEFRQFISQARASLSPSRFSGDDFRCFKRANNHATKERQVMTTVMPIIEGAVGDTKCVAGEIPFTNLDHLTDGTLAAANPDRYYGARPEQLRGTVRAQLSGRIIPSTQEDLPIAPNFFVEVKGPDGSAAVAERQLLNVMALGERGQCDLHSFRCSKPMYKNQAHTIGCTYQAGQLKMYATHVVDPSEPGAQPVFVMTQVDSWSLTGNPKSCREGIAAYRNARDWAKKERDQGIEQANHRAADRNLDDLGLSVLSEASAAETAELTSQTTLTNHGSNALSIHGSDTSEDELSLDHRPPDKRNTVPGKILTTRPNRSLRES